MIAHHKLLVVDDDQYMMGYLESILSNYELLKAYNGQDALELFKQNTNEIFLILSDLQMPLMNGLELLQEVKKLSPDTPFYLLTGFGNKEIVVKATNSGLDGFFDKPFVESILLEVVKEKYEIKKKLFDEELSLYETFFDDSDQLLEELEYKVATLSASPDNISDIKRILHTIKGGASFLNKLKQLEDICHRVEDMIKQFIVEKKQLHVKAITILLESIEILKTIVAKLRKDLSFLYDVRILYDKINTIKTSEEINSLDAEKEKRSEGGKSEGVFVQNEQLDFLLEIVGNLTILRNSFEGYSVDDGGGKDSLGKEFNHQLNVIANSLQTAVVAIRKVPTISFLRSYYRNIIELTKATGKKINFVINHNDVMVDKDVAKYLSESLIHLIRNSVGHGIEAEEVRKLRNKSIEGNISVDVFERPDSVQFIISDDGGGIDVDRVVAKAIETNVVTKEQSLSMSLDDKLTLIFCSGVSTAKEVTKISGRGEGMDIIKSSIAKINGVIRVESKLEVGTKMTITVPHIENINIVEALIFKVHDVSFALPIDLVERMIDIKENGNYDLEDGKFFMYEKNVIPVIFLKDRISFDGFKEIVKSTDDNLGIAIIVTLKGKKVALVVDEVVQLLQIVSRPLTEFVEAKDLLKGVALAKNGTPCYILDEHWLFKQQGDV